MAASFQKRRASREILRLFFCYIAFFYYLCVMIEKQMKLRSFFSVSISCILMTAMLVTLLSCRDSSKVSTVLDRGDSLLVSHPDSVLAMLDSIRDEVVKSPKSIRMRYELLHADAQNKAYVDFTTDSVMKEVAAYYDSHGTPNQKMQAHYLLGCAIP